MKGIDHRFPSAQRNLKTHKSGIQTHTLWLNAVPASVQIGHREVQWKGDWSLEQAPQGSGCNTEPIRAQGTSG